MHIDSGLNSPFELSDVASEVAVIEQVSVKSMLIDEE